MADDEVQQYNERERCVRKIFTKNDSFIKEQSMY